MDVETTAAIDGLRDTVNRRFDEVHDRLDRVATKEELRSEIAGVRSEIADVRSEIADTRSELRRHTEVMTESIRDDVRIVAEGLASLSAKIDARA